MNPGLGNIVLSFGAAGYPLTSSPFDDWVGSAPPLLSWPIVGSDEGEIEERESHEPFSRSRPLLRKIQLNLPDEVLGTDTVRIGDPDGTDPRGPE